MESFFTILLHHEEFSLQSLRIPTSVPKVTDRKINNTFQLLELEVVYRSNAPARAKHSLLFAEHKRMRWRTDFGGQGLLRRSSDDGCL